MRRINCFVNHDIYGHHVVRDSQDAHRVYRVAGSRIPIVLVEWGLMQGKSVSEILAEHGRDLEGLEADVEAISAIHHSLVAA